MDDELFLKDYFHTKGVKAESVAVVNHSLHHIIMKDSLGENIKIFKSRFLLLIILGVFILSPLFGVEAATNLSGRILLQVQDKGQAWYVSPINYQRYYLGTPTEAYSLMRQLGLGISNKDFSSIDRVAEKFAKELCSRRYGELALDQDFGLGLCKILDE